MFARLLAILLGLYLFSLVPARTLAADDEAQPAADAAQAGTATTEPDSEAEAAEPADPFAVPEGSNKELLEFIDTMRKKRPAGNSREELIENFKKALHSMAKASDKVLANQPDAEARAAASQAKLEALAKLMQLNDRDAQVTLQKFATELQAGDDEALAKIGKTLLMQLRLRNVMHGNAEEVKELLNEITEQVKANPDDTSAVRMAMQLGQALEHSGKTDMAIQAYRAFAEILAKSSEPEIQRHAKQLEGIVRRLELVGHPMELAGTLLDGKPFDPESIKGKVVLVDFWATWCGPCIGELPNVLSNYKKYHSKGFEVLAISLDDDRAALEKFVKERELPWPIMFDDTEGTRGWENPLAQKYGITGIPTVILIGADGNVVSLNARGESLGKLLEEKLGPPDESAVDEKADSAADKEDADK